MDREAAPVVFAKFSPNGKYVLVGALDDTLRLWDYEKRPQKIVKVYRGSRPGSLLGVGHAHVQPTQGPCRAATAGARMWSTMRSLEGVVVTRRSCSIEFG